MRRVSRIFDLVLPALPLVIVMGVMEFLVKSGKVPSYLIPAPTDVFRRLFVESGEIWSACGMTLLASIAGFFGSLIVGLAIGIALSTSQMVQRIFYPYAVFFQTVPVIAVAPLLVIWFGYGMPTVVASSFIVSVFPVIANTLVGLRSTSPALIDLFVLHRASRSALLFKLRIPSALPYILTGARISSGLAVIGAIVGEFIGGGGLGGVVDVARQQQRVDVVFAAVLLASVVGLLFFACINFASRLMLKKWHASET